jgi:hypothetical protein
MKSPKVAHYAANKMTPESQVASGRGLTRETARRFATLTTTGRTALFLTRFMNLHGSTIFLATDAHASVAVISVVSVVHHAPRGF